MLVWLMPTSQPTVVVSRLSVKVWLEDTPSVDRVRPAVCPRCEAPSRAPGESLGLHGHGLRSRWCLGFLQWGEPPGEYVVEVRRYLCTGCEQTCTVVPRGICPGRLYLIGTIGAALALWALSDPPVSAADVRRQISPFEVPTDRLPPRDWAALRRWTDTDDLWGGALSDSDLEPKPRAEVLAGICVGRSPPPTRGQPAATRAFFGAIRQAD